MDALVIFRLERQAFRSFEILKMLNFLLMFSVTTECGPVERNPRWANLDFVLLGFQTCTTVVHSSLRWWVFLVSPSKNDSFRKDLCFTADVLFIYFQHLQACKCWIHGSCSKGKSGNIRKCKSTRVRKLTDTEKILNCCMEYNSSNFFSARFAVFS